MIPERIEQNIRRDPETACWIWTAARARTKGYGDTRFNGKTRRAHRVIYELLRGPIPHGLTLDHLCRNRACVNPDHLEPVNIRVNILRGDSPSAINARKPTCKAGHPYTPENTHIDPEGRRICRECVRARERERYHSMTPERREQYLAKQRRKDLRRLARARGK